MKNFIEKFKEKKLLKYQKDKEKYEKMSNDELEIAYIDTKTNDRFFKIIGVQNRFYYLRISRILDLIFFLICDIINYERRCLWLKKVN